MFEFKKLKDHDGIAVAKHDGKRFAIYGEVSKMLAEEIITDDTNGDAEVGFIAVFLGGGISPVYSSKEQLKAYLKRVYNIFYAMA